MDQDNYIIIADTHAIYVIMSMACTPQDHVKAYAQAFQTALDPDVPLDYPALETKLIERGWKVNHVQMSTLGWKGHFV